MRVWHDVEYLEFFLFRVGRGFVDKLLIAFLLWVEVGVLVF
jgi:hypothetical protein